MYQLEIHLDSSPVANNNPIVVPALASSDDGNFSPEARYDNSFPSSLHKRSHIFRTEQLKRLNIVDDELVEEEDDDLNDFYTWKGFGSFSSVHWEDQKNSFLFALCVCVGYSITGRYSKDDLIQKKQQK